jgi:hypothetical protein
MPSIHRDPKAFTRWFRLDYFRRPRLLRRLYRPVLLGVLALTGAAAVVGVAGMILKTAGARSAFQAAPVSTAHALIADRCEVCHVADHTFAVARRLWPGDAGASSVSDQACLQCHPAGRHNEQQIEFINEATGQSQHCTRCHHEHRGDAALARLPDASCAQCHADLHTSDGAHRFVARITRFDLDHPAFGDWRHDPAGISDPGTVHFSHAAHLKLDEKLMAAPADRPASPWLEANRKEAKALEDQRCAYCHKMDSEKRYMLPIRYEDDCKACHPLLPQLQPNVWPPEVEEKFRQTPLHHPGPGETAETVRGELLDRFSRLTFAHPPAATPPDDAALRPFLLNRPVPSDPQRWTLGQVVHAERSLFAGDKKDLQPLPGFEKLVDFDVKGGCAYCHAEKGRSDDGLPLYEPPALPDRWLPHARFDHNAHRLMKCIDCHANAEKSTDNKDVLLPKIENCKLCHSAAADKARADCLECHGYHDHSGDAFPAVDPAAVDAVLKTPR